MRGFSVPTLMVPALALHSLLLVSSCSPDSREGQDKAIDSTRVPSTGLILQASEGERRMRRPRPSSSPVALGPFIIKVDGKNGGSADFFMGYEDIPPGARIPAHHHPNSDEILFIHSGRGVASLGSRTHPVGPGATIYIPQNTRISLRNGGPGPLTVAFMFPNEGIGPYLRETSVAEGDLAAPISEAQIAAIRERHREHITFDSAAAGNGGGLILQETQGERRLRRPPPSGVAGLQSPYLIKVDSRNGGSPTFFMGYSTIPPGDGIPPHHHPYGEEILFIQRGAGVATLGSREGRVAAGTTIYIPRSIRASLLNTGPEPMTLAFFFSKRGIEEYFRETSVGPGEPVKPFSPEELAAVRARHKEHIVFDQP